MKVLLTGGAGFIGSNLTKAFIEHPDITMVRVLDNFSTGYRQNLVPWEGHPKFELIEGSVTDMATCQAAVRGMNVICHQAALGSVPRSIVDPIKTNDTNVSGTLNVFTAAKEEGIQRIVYAGSSSTYGDSTNLPKIEPIIGRPLSPYAVSKYVIELYADVFTKTYNMEFIGLRYFNVFGPHQSPKGAYAAVIPLFMQAVINNEPVTINGDGSYSRDFTYVDNVVQANLQAMFTTNQAALNQVYNIAFGESTTLLGLFDTICHIGGSSLTPLFGASRLGDIPHSLADISKARTLLNYHPSVSVHDGLAKTYAWYKENQGYFL